MINSITPPPELVQQWIEETRSYDCVGAYPADLEQCVAARAAQWGADQELDACCEWFQEFYKTESWVDLDLRTFRAARRPKPPSLKEQALKTVDKMSDCMSAGFVPMRRDLDTIRKALEALPNG
jgi:hypothetical protein